MGEFSIFHWLIVFGLVGGLFLLLPFYILRAVARFLNAKTEEAKHNTMRDPDVKR